jgi:L-fuculose-phosphate aldolase
MYTLDQATFESLARVGKELNNRRLVASHAGNISIRNAGRIIIKKRAAMLGWLTPEDFISCSLEEEDSGALLASTETEVHRQIYLQTDAMAIIHAHSPYCVALSLVENEITCIDAEGIFMYKKLPVVELDVPAGASEAAQKVPPLLKNYPVVVVRSHGVFAKGITIEDALQNVTGAEQSAEVRYLTLLTGKPLIRDYSTEKNFKNW